MIKFYKVNNRILFVKEISVAEAPSNAIILTSNKDIFPVDRSKLSYSDRVCTIQYLNLYNKEYYRYYYKSFADQWLIENSAIQCEVCTN